MQDLERVAERLCRNIEPTINAIAVSDEGLFLPKTSPIAAVTSNKIRRERTARESCMEGERTQVRAPGRGSGASGVSSYW